MPHSPAWYEVPQATMCSRSGTGRRVQLRQAHLAGLGVDAAQQAVADDLGLLKDFLEHEVLVPALFRSLHVPVDVRHLLGYGPQGGRVHDLPGAGGDLDQLAVLQEDHVAGVGQKGRDV